MKGPGIKQLRPDCPDVQVPFKSGPPPTNVYLCALEGVRLLA